MTWRVLYKEIARTDWYTANIDCEQFPDNEHGRFTNLSSAMDYYLYRTAGNPSNWYNPDVIFKMVESTP